jgi:hypothetical protein
MGVDCKQMVLSYWEGCGAAGGHQASRTGEQRDYCINCMYRHVLPLLAV